jgi:hypothetical protein
MTVNWYILSLKHRYTKVMVDVEASYASGRK